MTSGRLIAAVVGTAAICLWARGPAVAATITIVPEGGFTDATPAAPVGGNAGTTVGQQRLIATQYAAHLWASRLVSDVEIRLAVVFGPLSCAATQGVLGSAGANAYLRDFAGAPLAGTLYPIALANALTGADQCPPNSTCTAQGFDSDDIGANFQSSIGTSGCLSNAAWYYGLDGNPGPKQFDFVTVALHEFAHGLGFVTLANPSTGSKGGGFDDGFMQNLEDHSIGLLWPQMSNAQRAASSTASGDLHWVGLNVLAAGASLVSGRDVLTGHIEMYAPNPVEFGSSVSHFSTSLTPDELMEPFITGPNHDIELAVAALKDIGWDTPTCGNGVVDPGEECDDGNGTAEDGCTNACTRCGNGTVTPPEQCDDGNLVGGDGCEAQCALTGALPAADYVVGTVGKADMASVTCAKAVGAAARTFLTTKYNLMRACADAVQEYRARETAGLAGDQTQAALDTATSACIEPSAVAPDAKTMLGRIADARRKAVSAIEKKCGPPGGTTVDGRPIANTASNDFSREAIAAHIDRVGCEAEALLGRAYNGTPAAFSAFVTRTSQGGVTLDRQFACLGSVELPAMDYATTDGKKDVASVACQRTVGTEVQQLLATEYAVVSRCLNATQDYSARLAAGLSDAQVQSALDAATRACVEPSGSASDARTMIGQLTAAETKTAGDIEQRCGVPGGSTVDGRPVAGAASGDLTRSQIQTHVSGVSCSVQRLLGLAYATAAEDLAHFRARTSQSGQPLDQLLPCVVP